MLLGLVLMAIFLLWLGAALKIYAWTLGPELPASFAAFFHDVFATSAGWALIGVGVGVGFLFALLVLTISVVSFPLLLDREAGIDTAIRTSVRAVVANPGPMALWGFFNLRTGEALRAPALDPVACWRVEQRNGMIFVHDKLAPARGAAARKAAREQPELVVIIGGGAAGQAAAEMLRRESYVGPVMMLSAENERPYDRPNL